MQMISLDGKAEFYHVPSKVAFVGGGGKSTLMYHLAEALAGQGKRVLVTTSTHIYFPSAEYYAATPEAVNRLWENGCFAVIGTDTGQGKLTQPEKPLMETLSPDFVLVEADGSKGFPVKVPREGEPVIWPDVELVICVMGLCAVGQRWKDCCFGLLPQKKANRIFTETDAAELLSRETGGRKDAGNRDFWVVLNQCDEEDDRRSAENIADMLKLRGISGVFMASFDAQERRYYSSMAKADNG